MSVWNISCSKTAGTAFGDRARNLLFAFVENGPDFSGDAALPQESAFRRAGAYVLSGIMLVLLCLALWLNLMEGAGPALLVLLGLTGLSTLVALLALWKGKATVNQVLFLLNGTMMLLGVCLLLISGAPNGGSLMWFIIFPPMVMLSMGLRRGTLLFAIFYFFLFLFMGTPLHKFLAEPFSEGVRLRFLLVMLGAFAFSWGSEFLRFHTHRAFRRASERLEKEAHTDLLTHLGNRRDFERHFQEARDRAVREQGRFSLLLIDLDHFKHVNDTYGHETGDAVLVHIAESMNRQTRPMEVAFRWGGEEFIVLLPGVDEEEAILAADRLRRYVEENPYRRNEEDICVTISIGVYSGSGAENLYAALGMADHGLYEAKENGRNRVGCVLPGRTKKA